MFEQLGAAIETFLYDHLVPTSGEILRANISVFIEQAGQLPTIGLIGLILSVLLMLYTIEVSFNDIYGVSQGRTPLQRIIVYWAAITLGPVLLVASLSITSYLVSLPLLSQFESDAVEDSAFLGFVPIIIEMIALLFLFVVVPNKKVLIRHAVAGVVVSAVLFQITKSVFVYLVDSFDTYKTIYGVLWTVPVFLIWIFLSWYVIVIGACVTAEFQVIRRSAK
ncbi:MAG: YihY family inner membrane protein [Pseudomonadota bacterium]|nr:YihY family inner membrane protein [Pseudomonadota bacterium]